MPPPITDGSKKPMSNRVNNDLLTGLLGPYWEIRRPIFFVQPELARAVRKSEYQK